MYRRGALLFFKVIHEISSSQSQCIKLTEMSTGPYGPVECTEHCAVEKATGPLWLGLQRAKGAPQDFRLFDPFEISYTDY